MDKYKKLFGLSFIFLSLVFSFPQKTEAQYTDILNSAKEYGLDGVAYFAANLALKRITNQTVNWINSGFKGNPAYVTDPTGFFLDIGDNVASDFLSGPKMNQLCTPFRAQVRLALVKNYISSNSNENYSCTLSTLKNNYNQFIDDFSQGGWDGWFEVTQNPSNNPYGAYLQAESSLFKQLGIEQNKYVKQLEQGKGFLSYEKCKASSVLTQSDINSLGAAGARYKVGDCWNNDVETVTPGTVIETQINKVLSTGNNRLEAADELDEIITALLTQLISRAIGGIGDGLRGATKTTPTQQSISDQLSTEPTTHVSSQPYNGTPSPSCTSSPSDTTCTTDINGITDCSSTPGSTTCNMPTIPVPTSGGGGTGGGGGGGKCADPGGTVADYINAVISAEGAVLQNNPSLASSLNTLANSQSFVSLLASELKNSGYEASGTVLSGNDVVHTENYIAVWRAGDNVIERYEVVNHAGDGDMTITNAAQASYSGDILISCAL